MMRLLLSQLNEAAARAGQGQAIAPTMLTFALPGEARSESWQWLVLALEPMPSPAVLRSNAVVEPLEERGRGGCCAAAAGVEREKHSSHEPGHLWGKVARLPSREDLLVAALS